jgi:hypothetical protein
MFARAGRPFQEKDSIEPKTGGDGTGWRDRHHVEILACVEIQA